MSTSCAIGYTFGGVVYYAYCVSDGYPDHMVPILRNIHDIDFLMKKIIDVHGFVFLNEDCTPEKRFPNEEAHMCALEEFNTDKIGKYIDYRYLYHNGTWKCYGVGPESFDEESEWKEFKSSYSNLLDVEHRNADGSYNFYKPLETEERQFLVMRVCSWDGNSRDNTVMTADELIHYIDMQDYCTERYKIYEITQYCAPMEIFYRGWQPGCLIEFCDRNGQIVLSGYGTDH